MTCCETSTSRCWTRTASSSEMCWRTTVAVRPRRKLSTSSIRSVTSAPTEPLVERATCRLDHLLAILLGGYQRSEERHDVADRSKQEVLLHSAFRHQATHTEGRREGFLVG